MNRWTALLRRALGHRSFMVGLTLTGLLALVALVSLIWTPYSAIDIDMDGRLIPPSGLHWFGQDHLGRDVLSLAMVGAQNSIMVGVIAVGVGLSAGTLLGTLAAAEGGWIDEAISRLSDLTFAFPALITAIMLTSVFGPGIAISIVAIGIFNIPIFARITRASAIEVWSRDYATAARAAGKGRLRITFDHVLPNIVSPLTVQGTVQFANAILYEATLSYLGLGTQPPQPSWGRMLNEAQAQIFQAPWLAVFPGLAIVLAVLGLNLLGDGVRDLLDPRLARGR